MLNLHSGARCDSACVSRKVSKVFERKASKKWPYMYVLMRYYALIDSVMALILVYLTSWELTNRGVDYF